ncbi:uncharacterized protein LOC126331452 [Schistocerca gregaria]|uniref:uncharacterized protein LOC126331452 n=1 Tax=Schistocerca gregaria TaxID=7010 RepID=UPI00211DBBD9|nr:uncharacterized protein LOC126331452 [Schistocerca gregaria]
MSIFSGGAGVRRMVLCGAGRSWVGAGPARGAARAYRVSPSLRITDAQADSFGKLVKSAIVAKNIKEIEEISNQYYDEVDEVEKVRMDALRGKQTRLRESLQAEAESMQNAREIRRVKVRDGLRRSRENFEIANARKQRPCFSERARAKAYELYKENKEYWNASRLANLFRVNIARMRISLWVSSIEEQAEAEGAKLDDTVESLLAEKYGELDFPGDIAEVPERIPYKKRRDLYFFFDDEVKLQELMKVLRTRDMNHYRESPRVPKRSIPPIVKVVPPQLESVRSTTAPNKFGSAWLMWDISPTKDMYNRRIVVRERDGSYRTGNWQERRYVEDYRRYIKWPVRVPFVRPDETQPDRVPREARIPEGYKVVFD